MSETLRAPSRAPLSAPLPHIRTITRREGISTALLWESLLSPLPFLCPSLCPPIAFQPRLVAGGPTSSNISPHHESWNRRHGTTSPVVHPRSGSLFSRRLIPVGDLLPFSRVTEIRLDLEDPPPSVLIAGSFYRASHTGSEPTTSGRLSVQRSKRGSTRRSRRQARASSRPALRRRRVRWSGWR